MHLIAIVNFALISTLNWLMNKGLISKNMVKSSASNPEITHDKVTLVKK